MFPLTKHQTSGVPADRAHRQNQVLQRHEQSPRETGTGGLGGMGEKNRLEGCGPRPANPRIAGQVEVKDIKENSQPFSLSSLMLQQ